MTLQIGLSEDFRNEEFKIFYNHKYYFLILILFLAYIRLSGTKVFIYKSNELDGREVVFNFKKCGIIK